MFGKHKMRKEHQKHRISSGSMDRLESMLEDAMNGVFEESEYDESRLSRLEVKWKRFLSSSVTSRQRLKEEQEKIKMLISDISHQTKTPLANIVLYAQILQEQETNPELTYLVDNIREQSEKLNFLIGSLVKASRLESEVLILQPVRQKIKPMLHAVLSAMEEEAARKQITVLLDAAEEEAEFDRKWTEEAILNLLDNAIKYSSKGSIIRVSVSDYEMFAAVHVSDEGIGIAEEEQAQIFDRFYRSSSVSKEKGVGLGLFLTREIARKQNGYVKVKSKIGKGSTFSFYMHRGA